MKIFFGETGDDGTVGGSHACMYNLVRHMDRGRFDFTVGFRSKNLYMPRYADLEFATRMLPAREPLRGGNPLLRKLRNWQRLERAVQAELESWFRAEGFDLVVLNNSVFVSLPYIRACRRLSIPVIVYERGIGYLLRRHVRASRDITVGLPVSRAVLAFLQSYRYRAPRTEIIYDGIDPDAFRVERSVEAIKSDLGLPAGCRTIGMVGNIKPWKGQQYFVEAFIELARRREDLFGLVIGGHSDEAAEFRDGLLRRVAEAGLEERLLFLGYRKDVHELLSTLDVFVHASVEPEPFGMVLLEAMAARRPLVATGIGGPLEILADGDCGMLVPPADAAALAAACDRYLGDAETRERMVEKAHARLVGSFHIRQTVDRTSALFEEIATSRQA